MFGNLFGAKNKSGAEAVPRSRRVNIEKRFSIIGETGQGSMSHVYKAFDNEGGRTICLKVQDLDKATAAASRASQAGRLSEGDIGLKIHHPRVVRTFEHGVTTKGAHYLVMEFVDGVSLQNVRQSRITSLAEKLEFLAQAAEGLAAVHQAGFIHHDIGPKNFLVDREDHVKLLDFGLTVPNTPAFQRGGNRTGTIQYMAPEVIRRESKDEKIDIFAFGAMMFEFLTNKLPYDAVEPMKMMTQRMNSEPHCLNDYAPDLPEDLKAIVDKTLKKNPKDRWASMADLSRALREVPCDS